MYACLLGAGGGWAWGGGRHVVLSCLVSTTCVPHDGGETWRGILGCRWDVWSGVRYIG